MTDRGSSLDIEPALNWLEGCLKCKTWSWDGLQREAAEKALADAREALRAARSSAGTEDVRWAVNVLLEKIAAKFEAWDTYDLWRSDAAATVRSFKHDLSIDAAQAAPQPVAYVPLSKAEADKGEPIWREVFAAKWLEKDVWRGFDLMPLYASPLPSTDRGAP